MKIHILKLCRSASGVRCRCRCAPKPTQTVLTPTCQNAMESYLPTCINPCKSGDGSCLKKIDLPTQGGGVEVGILGGQQIKSQNSGKCHELSRKSIKKKNLHIPPRGVPGRGVGGQHLKSPINFMNCRENR